MTLKEYIKEKELTLKDMQNKTGINFRTIHKYVKRKCLPNMANAQKIFKATKGKVSLMDWRP